MALIERKFQLDPNIDGLGLSCTAEGVALAGVPLLRKTAAGLRPRPLGELAVLMKSAYGPDVDPARWNPGLEVIAKALNEGDVGRAMVAAIRLKLPNLNEERAAHIARADETLAKYDPNEPRDERGRWTSGGGGSSSQSTRPVRHPSASGQTAKKPVLASLNPLSVASAAVNMGLTRNCINNAQEPRYFKKTQLCMDVMNACSMLYDVNSTNALRMDFCIWPDGAAAAMKMGILAPIKFGHKF